MPPPSSPLRRTFLLLTLGTLAVFAVLLVVLTLMLRTRLRDEVLQRDANAIQAVARLQVNAATARLNKLGVGVTTADVFAAVLESSRLSGVLAVQLYDEHGTLRDALPAVTGDAISVHPWWTAQLPGPAARFTPKGSLEAVFGFAPEPNTTPTLVPLLDVAVPLGRASDGSELGVARYWIHGDQIAAEFNRMDRRLATQAGLSFLGAAVLLAVLLAWTYQRLAHAEAQLLAQSADLARANQELDFAAKTGALGAISAHLIHGLKNPLAGLEGFVAEMSDTPAGSRGEAQQTAIETTRRLRAMVNEIVAVLRDEASGSADYRVPLHEALDGVAARASATASAAQVGVQVVKTSDATLNARTANLAGLVLANLIGNAIEASPRRATVRVEAGRTDGEVEFLVIDAGPGLPPHVRESLFRPVQSSKPAGGGMGLAISHRLARHAGGELTLVRSDDDGTVFRLVVPAV